MNLSFAAKVLFYSCIAATAFFILAPMSHAQAPGSPPPGGNGGVTNQTTMGAGGGLGDSLSYGTVGHQQERDQVAAFQAFSKESDAAKKIAKGREFLRKYPKSPFEEQVDAVLTDTYRTQADWTNEYHYADQALALNPNDPDVLATVGWTIPHVYQTSDPNAQEELDKAEKYAKHALEALAALAKPHSMNDEEFAAAKAKRTFQAHSALGLVYFRRQDYDNSAKELELATKDNPAQDQTDLYVLGVDRMHLSRFGEAADAFHGCSQIAGALQDPCKKNATAADAQAGSAKTQ
jgi:tetratricopeptide (TPR) repeat protein